MYINIEQVSEKQAWKELLSVTVSEQEADYNVNSGKMTSILF